MRWTNRILLLAILAITHVDVVSMRDARIDRDRTVIVSEDRIASIAAAEDAAIPEGARVIDGRGRWLLPGLIDSHVHILREDLPAYLAHGVTTVRDLAGLESVLVAARLVDAGELQGPHIVTSSLLLNGPNPRHPEFSRIVTAPSQADAVVAEQLARGVTFVKLYENLPLATYDALVLSARARGAKIAGHVSSFVSVEHAMASQDSIEHLNGYERVVSRIPNPGADDIGAWISVDATRYPELARRTAESGVWNCPTLYVYGVLATDAERPLVLQNRRAFVAELHAHGANLLAGTDSGYLVPAGTALFEELRELHAAGLTLYDTLVTATRAPAIFLGASDLGTIEEGKRADLLLLSANPLETLDALAKPALVIVGGRPVTAPRRRAAGQR